MYLQELKYKLSEGEVGGKASSLTRLLSLGVNVPAGFVVTNQTLEYYQSNGVFPNGFENDLERLVKNLNSKELIVRSSAVGEDSVSHSFAGQLDSYVANTSTKEILDTIVKCWSGLQNDRVLAYQKISGKKLSKMGVVVQSFVKANYAGVLFTHSPYNDGKVYAEYVAGDGEQLVSGKVTPKSFSFGPDGKSSDSLPFDPSVLVKQSLMLKKAYGCELDIEWVFANQQFYFVQARPITVKSTSKVYWTNTNLNENYPDPICPLQYSIARDSYYHYFKNLTHLLQIDKDAIRALESDFSNTVGVFGNRIYYNMTSIHNIISASPLQHYFKDAFNTFVGYDKANAGSAQVVKKSSPFKLMRRLIKLNLQLERHVKTIEEKVSEYSKRGESAKTLEDYNVLFHEFLDLRFHQWYHASLADFFAMIHYKLLGKFTRRYYGEQSVGVHNTLVQAIPGLISSQPLNDTWDIVQEIEKVKGGKEYFSSHSAAQVYDTVMHRMEWNEVRKGIERYLQLWGFRCSGELMFFNSNYSEDPVKFIELVQGYMQHTATNPRKLIAQKDLERKKAMRKFTGKIFKKRHIFIPWSLVDTGRLYLIARLCKQGISSRERVRYKQAEMYFVFKRSTQQIGKLWKESGLLEHEQDIFYLTYKEISELLSSSYMFNRQLKETIAQRKKEFEEESAKTFPHSFATEFGKRPEEMKSAVEWINGAHEFKGLAASGGRIKGRIKVLESVLEGHKIQKGDILVTRQTDPGWATVFPLISGLIVERGGALSHGAIVAREFGIPAVIGIDNITRLLKDNDEVILDGDLGKIQKIQ